MRGEAKFDVMDISPTVVEDFDTTIEKGLMDIGATAGEKILGGALFSTGAVAATAAANKILGKKEGKKEDKNKINNLRPTMKPVIIPAFSERRNIYRPVQFGRPIDRLRNDDDRY